MFVFNKEYLNEVFEPLLSSLQYIKETSCEYVVVYSNGNSDLTFFGEHYHNNCGPIFFSRVVIKFKASEYSVQLFDLVEYIMSSTNYSKQEINNVLKNTEKCDDIKSYKNLIEKYVSSYLIKPNKPFENGLIEFVNTKYASWP